MTTVSAEQATRIGPRTSPANRVGARGSLAAMVLVLMAILFVDNHLMALPGSAFADIGVSAAVLQDPVRSLVPPRRAAPGYAGAAASRSTGGPARELHRCFVRARRSGQDPAGCRTGRAAAVVAPR